MAIAPWLKTQNSSIDFTICDRRRCKDGCKCSIDEGYARNHCGECVLEEGTYHVTNNKIIIIMILDHVPVLELVILICLTWILSKCPQEVVMQIYRMGLWKKLDKSFQSEDNTTS